MPINSYSTGSWKITLPEIPYYNIYNTYSININSNYYFTISYCPKKKEIIQNTIMDIE